MSETNGTAVPSDNVTATSAGEDLVSKGKGKAVDSTPAQDLHMDEDDDESEEEEEGEDAAVDEVEEEDEDNMEEIDTSNIIGGRRTRGKAIDYAEAEKKAQEAGDKLDDDDEDDDDDFEGDDDDDAMKD